MKAATYLKTFFEEKNLPFAEFEIETVENIHFISNEIVIEHIMVAPAQEQEQIADIIRKIDFKNGNVNHFLEHLAHGLAQNF